MDSSRLHRSIIALIAALGLAIPSAAVADAPVGGHGDADAQSTKQQDNDGPSAPGLAWWADLGLKLENEPDDHIVTSNELFLVQGNVHTDLPSTPEDESEDARGALIAVQSSDGGAAWDAPLVDIAAACIPVATSDDRIIAHQEANSVTNPGNNNDDLVAIDATTGALLEGGQRYTSPETGDEPRLKPCRDRLLMTPDESTVIVDNGSKIRAIDISSTPWTQLWLHEPKNNDDGAGFRGDDLLLLSADGKRLYYAMRYDQGEGLWGVQSIDVATGNEIDLFELPDGSKPDSNNESRLAIEGGLLITVVDCGDPDCVVKIDDDGTSLTLDFQFDTVDDPTGFNSLAAIDEDTVVGFANDGADVDLYALNLTGSGSIEWHHEAPSAAQDQLVTDGGGNAYYSGGPTYSVESLSPDGNVRWHIDPCHLDDDAVDPTGLETIGPISADSTLFATARDNNDGSTIVYGFRSGESLPKGTCPEEDTRVSGLNRVETSVEVSNASFPQPDSADTVVLATSTNYPDALAGGPLARKLDAPLLLTSPSSLSAATAEEIQRLGATHAVLLGGTGALATKVESDVKALGLSTERLAGTNRFETAGMIADRVPATTVYVTEGANANPNRGWPDAVAVSGLASFELRPIILATSSSLPQASRDAMVKLGATDAVVVGGETAVSAATAAAVADPDGDGTAQVNVTRESGASRYGTSVELAKRSVKAGASTFDLWFATGLSFPDALAAGPAVARSGGVLLLVNGKNPNGGLEIYQWLQTLDEADTLRAWLVGGTGAVSDEVANKLVAAASIDN